MMKISAVTVILVSIFLTALVIILDIYEVNHIYLNGHLSSWLSCRCNQTKNILATTSIGRTAYADLDKSTYVIPHLAFHKKLMMRRLGARGGRKTNISLFSAFEYPQQINVVITSSAKYGDDIYCRYFDMSMQEIGKPFKSVVFPEYSTTCVRRNGARFMSLSDTVNGQFEYPVPITDRTQSEPSHFFSICLAPIYGTEPKWLQLAELVEHYKIQGATHFYIYLKYIDEYSRALLDDYVRTGDAEVITLYDRFKRKDRGWQSVEIQECLNRARRHSQWVAFVDLDERLTPTKNSGTLQDLLNLKTEKCPDFVQIDPADVLLCKVFQDLLTDTHLLGKGHNISPRNLSKKIGGIQFRQRWILKNETLPKKYTDADQVASWMPTRRYHITSHVGPIAHTAKCIIDPEKVLIMSVHSVLAFFKHYSLYRLEPDEGVVRHYRDVNFGRWGKRWLRGVKRMGKFSITDYPEKWANELLIKVQKRLHNVYGGKS